MNVEPFKVYTLWAIFERDRDPKAEDPWIVHCLELDVVTQGKSLAHACGMIADAVSIVLLDDLNRGHNPLVRRAPEQSWAKLFQLLRSGRRVDDIAGLLENEPAELDSFAAPMELNVVRRDPIGAPGWSFPAPAFASDAGTTARP